MGYRIVMLGAPGAGKGTQAQRIAAAHGMPHISTGDIFRAHLKQGTDLGKRVKQYLDAGELVPDAVTCEIVEVRLAEQDCRAGFVLDGFPRSLPQAEMLDKCLGERAEPLDVAVDVAVPDEEIIDRLTARRTDPETGRIYNLKFDPPPADVAARVIQRNDDKPETIRQRLVVYHETTEPLIVYYRNQGILRTIESAGLAPDSVFAKIEEILAGLKAAG